LDFFQIFGSKNKKPDSYLYRTVICSVDVYKILQKQKKILRIVLPGVGKNAARAVSTVRTPQEGCHVSG
jgi:hypothetical protein